MGYSARRYEIAMTTNTSQACTAYTGVPVDGKIDTIQYVKTDFADGSTMTLTGNTTGIAIWAQTGVNASATVAPRQATHSTAGVAALYAATGTAVLDKIPISGELLKVVVANGGASKTGKLWITVTD